MNYTVTVKAYGRISVKKVDAENEAEAIEKALRAVGFSVEVKEAS